MTAKGKDLGYLRKEDGDYEARSATGQKYSFNFCKPIEEDCGGDQVGLCRITEVPETRIPCGLFSSERAVDGPGGSVSLRYDRASGGGSNPEPMSVECGTPRIEFHCGTDLLPQSWNVVDRSINIFLPREIIISTKITLGCPDYVPYHPLSHGWIFVIVVIFAASLYCAIGVVYNTKSRGLSGIEAIPQADFWRELPALVAEGCVYFWAWVTDTWDKYRNRGGSGYQEIPGDSGNTYP